MHTTRLAHSPPPPTTTTTPSLPPPRQQAAPLLASRPSGLPLVAANKPLILLVNKGSASSSEALAAALHDNGR